MGSMFARRAGADDTLPPVMVGSHLDTQPTGGKFDGALGVMAALEVVRTLNDLDIKTRHPIEIAMWTNEEGSRFAPAMVASGVFAGELHARAGAGDQGRGRQGVRRGAASGSAMRDRKPVGGRPVHAFFELHIEQGPILEEAGIDIGIVTAANGQKWYEITLTGVESHAGPTPMNRRKDALLGAARIVELVNAIGHAHDPAACATVRHDPGLSQLAQRHSRQVFLTVDFRHPLADKLFDGWQLRAGLADIAASTGLTYEMKMVADFPPQPFEASLRRCRAATRPSGSATRRATSRRAPGMMRSIWRACARRR